MIDLNTCQKGDILISSQGLELEYISRTPYKHYTYLDHVVKYPSDKFGSENYGTRTNDGFTFLNNRKPEIDHDIVKIIKKQKIMKNKRTSEEDTRLRRQELRKKKERSLSLWINIVKRKFFQLWEV
jgi:hypothetical protein